MTVKKDGYSTTAPKIGTEGYLSYNLTDVLEIGQFVCSEAGSGTYEDIVDDDVKYDAIVEGSDLVVRVNSPKGINSASDIDVTIVGTDSEDAETTGTATILALSAMDQSWEVTSSTEYGFKTITSVTISEGDGLIGDGFDIAIMPNADNDTEIGHAQGCDAGAATGEKAIYDHLDKTHSKVIRGDRSFTISQLLKNHKDGLLRIKNRSVSVKQEVKDDSGNVATETYIWGTCQLASSQTFPASAAEDDMTVAAEGTYGKLYVFS
jgi:hypothetical protein